MNSHGVITTGSVGLTNITPLTNDEFLGFNYEYFFFFLKILNFLKIIFVNKITKMNDHKF